MFSHLPALPKLFNSQGKWLEQQQTSILSAAAIITSANIISAVSGFIRERLMLGIFYTEAESSREAYAAFKLAFQVPDILFQLIVLGALSAAFIPVYTSIKNKSTAEAQHMTAILLNVLLLVFLVIGVVVFMFAEQITSFRTGAQFTPHQLEIATNLTRVMLFGQLFFAVSNLLGAYLQSHQRFVIPSIAPIMYNIGILGGVYLLANQFGIYAAGIGVIIGAGLHMLLHLPLAFKLGFRPTLSLNILHPGVKELLLIAPARIGTVAITQFESLGMGYFLTSVGSVSFLLFSLAESVVAIPIRFFGIPISQAALSFLSRESSNKDLDRFKELVIQSLNQIAFLIMPTAVLVLILRVPIVRFLFGTDSFPWSDTITTGKIVAILAISIAAQAMSQLLMRAFYALKDTQTPFGISLFTVCLYFTTTAGLLTFTNLGILGIAATLAISEIVKMLLLVLFFEHKLPGVFGKMFWIPQLKIFTAAFLMAVFLYLPFRILDQLVFDTSRTIELIGLSITTTTIGTLVYLYFAALFDIQELRLLSKAARSVQRWRSAFSTTQEVVAETRSEDMSI